MKRQQNIKIKKKFSLAVESARRRLKMGGKFLHGTRGKPTNGPRGNKKY